jgi:hypothetical protein
LRQCTDTAAEVDTANKTLRAYRIGIDTGQAALTRERLLGLARSRRFHLAARLSY